MEDRVAMAPERKQPINRASLSEPAGRHRPGSGAAGATGRATDNPVLRGQCSTSGQSMSTRERARPGRTQTSTERGRHLRPAAVARFSDLAVNALAAAREEIDALNVYPVPDGDTGTNLFLTLEAARDALARAPVGESPDADRRAACPASPAARCSAPAATPA